LCSAIITDVSKGSKKRLAAEAAAEGTGNIAKMFKTAAATARPQGPPRNSKPTHESSNALLEEILGGLGSKEPSASKGISALPSTGAAIGNLTSMSSHRHYPPNGGAAASIPFNRPTAAAAGGLSYSNTASAKSNKHSSGSVELKPYGSWQPATSAHIVKLEQGDVLDQVR
jgi:hypothetical protein